MSPPLNMPGPLTVEGIQTPCPYCGADTGTHTALSGQVDLPQPGEFSICSHCGEVGTFEDTGMGLFLRLPTPEEAELHAASPEVAFARTLVQLNKILMDANTKRE